MKTKEKPVDLTDEEDAEAAAALHRVMTRPAIDMTDLAVLTGVHYSTLRRKAISDDGLPYPLTASRIGQRWVIPSVGVRKMLGLGDAQQSGGEPGRRSPFVLEV